MADKVQKQLEDLVPDLQELLSQELFSPKEVKNIIERRREFEFDILSPDPNTSLHSYKKYIEYELELDKLIESRYRKSKKANKSNLTNINGVTSGDNKISNTYNGTNRKRLRVDMNNKRFIHRLFRRCLNRFINNIEVYNSYLSFCRQIKAYKLFERVIMNGLSKNPNDENLWLILGSYILKNRGITASKNIIQRSLRIIPNNLNLILYLFQLEVKSLLEIASTFSEDKHSISQSISKYYIIFEYGCNNLNERDKVVFYFSILSIFNELFKLKEYKEELDELLDKINNKISKSKIPIITLYNYQIRLLENTITGTTATGSVDSHSDTDKDGNETGDEKEDTLLSMFSECYKNNKKTSDHSRGLLILMLQFIYNAIERKNKDTEVGDYTTGFIIDVNPRDTLDKSENENSKDKIVSSIYINSDKEYLIKNYCILENIYYICLLGDIPEYYKIESCKYTSSLAKNDQLKMLKGLYSNYLNSRLDEIINFTLKLYPEDPNEIYYHLKLLIHLSELDESISIRSKVLNKVDEVLRKLATINGLIGVNDELVQIILKLSVDFNLRVEVFENFKSLALNHFNFFIDRLFNLKFKENERIELFLLFYKHNEGYEYLENFLKKLENLGLFNSFIANNSKYINNNLFNQLIAYISDKIETTVDELNTDTIEAVNINKDVNMLNGLILNKKLDLNNENKQKLNSLNVKLRLFNCSLTF